MKESISASFDVTDVEQWLSRLEGVVPRGPNEWFALCPAHDDRNPSLSILDTDEGCLVHCFAGCSFGEIVQAVDGLEVNVRWRSSTPAGLKPVGLSGLSLWQSLFRFPIEELDPFFVGGVNRHITLQEDRIQFHWPTSDAVRYRLANPTANQKGYVWGPGGARPPLWPELESQMEAEVFLTEGESDCIILRRLGLPAYALTTGGSKSNVPRFSKTVIRDMISRGVKKIYLAFDDDDTGHTTAGVVYRQIQDLDREMILSAKRSYSSVEVAILPIADIAYSYLGEKDIRQIAMRIRDFEDLAYEFRTLKETVDRRDEASALFLTADFLKLDLPPVRWLVKDVLQQDGIGWISGFPKMGKTWIAMDLAFSIAYGSPFLDFFDVLQTGDVLYVGKENSNASLQSRIARLQKAKQLVSIEGSPGPKSSVVWDTSREFRFEPMEVQKLVVRAKQFEQKFGRKFLAVIIDPLSFSLPSSRDFDINNFTDFQRHIVDSMSTIVHKLEAACVLVHHQSKGDNNTMLGSVAAEASFDNKLMFMTKNRGAGEYIPGDPVRLQLVHRDGESKTVDLSLDLSDDGYHPSVTTVSHEELRSDNAMKVKVSYLDRQKKTSVFIFQAIDDVGKPEFTFREMAAAFRARVDQIEVSDSLLNNTFAWLQGEKAIEQIRHGVYRRASS